MSVRSDQSRMIQAYVTHRKICLDSFNTSKMDEKTLGLYNSIVAVMTAESFVEYEKTRGFDNHIAAKVVLYKALEQLENTVKGMMR